MPIYYQSQLEEIAAAYQGIRVEAAAARIIVTPGTTLFTVSGGNVIMTGFIGEVTTSQSATATTVVLLHTPTVGTATTLATGATDIASLAAGDMILLPAVLGATLTKTATAAGTIVQTKYILRPGIMSVYGSDTPTGAIKWYMWYVPMEYGAYVTGV